MDQAILKAVLVGLSAGALTGCGPGGQLPWQDPAAICTSDETKAGLLGVIEKSEMVRQAMAKSGLKLHMHLAEPLLDEYGKATKRADCSAVITFDPPPVRTPGMPPILGVGRVKYAIQPLSDRSGTEYTFAGSDEALGALVVFAAMAVSVPDPPSLAGGPVNAIPVPAPSTQAATPTDAETSSTPQAPTPGDPPKD